MTMADLIDRNALYNRIVNESSTIAEIVIKNTGHTQYLTVMADRQNEILDMISEMPTIDAVPVVRCKDCRYSGFDPEYGKRWCERCWGSMLVQDDDFCSYGEKREV